VPVIKLSFEKGLVDKYSGQSQKIRVLTEDWVSNQIYCPSCGNLPIQKYENNRPVADFFCSSCQEDYELKSKKGVVITRIVDGAYHTMIERLQESHNPNLFLLNYDFKTFEVQNFLVIPKHFFIPEIIEKRKPLSQKAIRAGWVGCNIILQSIPETGKIFFIKDKVIRQKEKVLAEWQRTLFLREEKELGAKGWLIDIMICVEKLGRKEFSLEEVYGFENVLTEKHPDNHHIKAKIRQQLQLLRDKGYLEFIERGRYRFI
jgi:type II restriction enzyme